MKEYPILFSAPMARAICEGRKTQTRRMVKPQPTHRLIEGVGHFTIGMDPALDGQVWYDADCIHPGREVLCPYGRVGDRLVFLCGWATEMKYDRVSPSKLPLDARLWTWFDGDTKPEWCGRTRMGRHMMQWMRARMPRGEIVSRLAERVKDISESDAIAEGFAESFDSAGGCHEQTTARENFLHTFYDLNKRAPRGSNPWVWAVEFRRVK